MALALAGNGRPAYGPVDGPAPGTTRRRICPGGRPRRRDGRAGGRGLAGRRWRTASASAAKLSASFTIVYPASDSTRQALALGAAQQLQAIGIDAQPSGRSWDEIEAMMHSSVVVFGWGRA